MANVLVQESSLQGIANAIRGKNGSSDTYRPADMAAAITAIPTGGGKGIEVLTQDENDYPLTVKIAGFSTKIPKYILSNLTSNEGFYIKTTDVVFPTGITEIDNKAFYNCAKLAVLNLPSSVEVIGERAFYGCSQLALDNLPSSIRSIGDYAFANCSNLRLSQFPSAITTISAGLCYGCTALNSIKFGGDITVLNSAAFRGCTNILQYDFTNNTAVPRLSTNVFYGINANCKIIVPDNLYDTWVTANNWTTYASYVVKQSNYAQN